MGVSAAIAIAAVFIWVGLVVGISFIEAPLKFRAAGVTLPIGLGIGRLVFRALNAVEVVLAAVLVIALTAGGAPSLTVVASAVAIALLAAQLIGVRPVLTKRSDAVLAGEDGPRSSAHLVYVALETLKLLSLVFAGVAALAGRG